jgi:hypothetical protein
VTLWANDFGNRIDDICEVSDVANLLAPDALKVLVWLARRLKAGQLQYGRLDLSKDKRDWRVEKREEILDYLIYDAMEEVQRG